MNLHAYAVGVLHHSNIAGNYSTHTALLSHIHYLMHQRHIIIIDDSVHGEIGFNPVFTAHTHYLTQIISSEVRR